MQNLIISPADWLLPVLLLLIGGNAWSAEERPVQKLAGDEIAVLIEQLEHPEFDVREAATRRLLAGGTDSISAISEVALAGPPEAATRALQVLEGHLLSGERSRFEPADDALQRLSQSAKGTVAVGASNILSRHNALREERAVAKVRELGATVTYDVDGADTQRFRGPAIWGPQGRIESRGLRPKDIVIGSDWTGGTEGLKYFRGLSHWHDMRLYVVRASGVPLAEAEKLASVLPGLTVQERGAYLGISNSPYSDPEHCVVGAVLTDGPAGRAGLKERDIILELNGDSVGGFESLIEKLKDRAPGERVTMTVARSDFQSNKREQLTVEVELGKWELPDLTEAAARAVEEAQEAKAARREHQHDTDESLELVPTEAFPLFER